jgi:hypothetical protein
VVRLTEFAVQLPQQMLAAGTYRFVVANGGTLNHALEIIGPSGMYQRTETLSPGHFADLTVTLPPGDYKFFCPVSNHQEQGMGITMTVGGDGNDSALPPVSGGH